MNKLSLMIIMAGIPVVVYYLQMSILVLNIGLINDI